MLFCSHIHQIDGDLAVRKMTPLVWLVQGDSSLRRQRQQRTGRCCGSAQPLITDWITQSWLISSLKVRELCNPWFFPTMNQLNCYFFY
uniref:Uncharacterized protein n=2 Tax=Zea mays TaxID=4577 RepID=A0A804R5V8_MAIZE